MTFVSDEQVKQRIENFNEEEYNAARGEREDIAHDVKSVLEECVDDVVAGDRTEVDELISEISKEFNDFQYEIRRKNLHEAGKHFLSLFFLVFAPCHENFTSSFYS